MRQINYKKLLHSKWTSLSPENKEKHFSIIKVYINNEDKQIVDWVTLEAVLTKRVYKMKPSELCDELIWSEGWL